MTRTFSTYQLVHLMKLLANRHNCLFITDGVGVGKTISGGYILFHQSNIVRRPSLIVCPPVLVEKWINEMRLRFGMDIRNASNLELFELMVDEIGSGNFHDNAPIYITTYSLLSRQKELDSPDLGLILFDEIHHVRNPETIAHKSALRLSKNADYRVGLSATPINNSLTDLAGILTILLKSYSLSDIDDLLNDLWESDLIDSLSSMTTRFMKEQLMEQFTTRNIHTELVEYPSEYVLQSNQVVESIMMERGGGSFFEKIIFYRLASSSPPAFLHSVKGKSIDIGFNDPKADRLCELLASKPDERWLIFTEFKETARYLDEQIDNRLVLVLSGDKTADEKAAITNIFAAEENSVLIMTPVGSEGLDFQICSNLVNYDLHWNPMKIEQRIGRIDRIGQEKDEIDVHNFIANGSIDERVIQVIRNKLSLVSESFVDIMPIVETKNPGRTFFDLDSLNSELDKAEELVSALGFYQKFTSNDLKVLESLQTEYCDVIQWEHLDWGTQTPWAMECIDWYEDLQQKGAHFDEILSAYTKS